MVFFRFSGLYMIIVSACRNAYEMYVTSLFRFSEKMCGKCVKKYHLCLIKGFKIH